MVLVIPAGDPCIKVPDGYGIIIPLPQATMNMVAKEYICESFHNFDVDVALCMLAFQRWNEVDWTYVDGMMTYQLILYD